MLQIDINEKMWEISQKVCSKAPFLVLYFSAFSSKTSFLFLKLLHNYSDDNSIYCSGKSSNIVIRRLRHNFAIISEWFYESYMVLSPDKFHFLTLGFNNFFPNFCFENTIIKNVTEEKTLGIVIDDNPNFRSLMKNICGKS